MPVFFIAPEQVQNNVVIISDDLFNHIKGSLRARVGETITVCVQNQYRYRVRVDEISKKDLKGHILDRQTAPPPSDVKISLGLAMLKGDHMDWVIQKVCEIGVASITPLVTKRVVVKLQDGWQDFKFPRWQRIALEAAQQSEQWNVPQILIPSTAKLFFSKKTASALNLILSERWPGQGLGTVRLPRATDSLVRIAVGPEGGWEKEELEYAMSNGFSPINMGYKILRAETAALAALSIVQSRLGELG
jgi:16S rRNA (uracil1498-N3)-methyltransferase